MLQRSKVIIKPVLLLFISFFIFITGCKKGGTSDPDPGSISFGYSSLMVNGAFSGFDYKGINRTPIVKIAFSSSVDQTSFTGSVAINDKNMSPVTLIFSTEKNDSILVIKTANQLLPLSKYSLNVYTGLKSKAGGSLLSPITVNLTTAIDSTNKFATISNDALLELIQKQTFSYFWDFGHPVSGMARERNSSGDVVTTGGTGFGIMAIPVAIERNFISRTDGLLRIQKMVDFLTTKAVRFHGAYSHWINGSTGAVVPFSTQDNGADLVETSYLMMGLLTARQYFDGTAPNEAKLRDDINKLWNDVEWDWFRRDGGNVLYWHWSSNYGWAMNMPIRGWNECLITYVLAASSTIHGVPKTVYDSGFANNGAMKNNNNYLGIELPLGPAFGGPLFFEHYSFMGINPKGLTDTYADYWKQVVNHSKINYEYCKANSKGYYGYSDLCWGLTASDIKDGYTASSPTNDVGVIAPTAAISSLPYTPTESMKAIGFFYYQLGDKIWGSYGFKDAFDLNGIWFADSYLAIDQGPQIVMIENYRTGLLWKLFMGCPEIKIGMKNLGFQSPNL